MQRKSAIKRVKRKDYLPTIFAKNDLVKCHAEASVKLSHNVWQLTADGPSRNNLRENRISNIRNFSQRTTTGHLRLGAVRRSLFSYIYRPIIRAGILGLLYTLVMKGNFFVQ